MSLGTKIYTWFKGNLVGNDELGNYYPKVKDRIQYAAEGVNKVARIISVNTSRGNSPILHTVIVRVQ